jgi:hypothetical protein
MKGGVKFVVAELVLFIHPLAVDDEGFDIDDDEDEEDDDMGASNDEEDDDNSIFCSIAFASSFLSCASTTFNFFLQVPFEEVSAEGGNCELCDDEMRRFVAEEDEDRMVDRET